MADSKVSALTATTTLTDADETYVVDGGVSKRATVGTLKDQLLQDAPYTFRNLLINASGRVNQRGYVSTTVTTGANEYTLDRWRVVTLGEALIFASSGNVVLMTAPTNGIEQEIEGVNVDGGTYKIHWTGTATCTVDGAAKTTGASVTLTANTNAVVKFSGGTFSSPQLEKGNVTDFENRSYGNELSMCQRYYESGTREGMFSGDVTLAATYFSPTSFRSTKRVAPTVTLTNISSAGFSLTPGATSVNVGAFTESRVATATLSAGFFLSSFIADAEI